MTKASRAGVKRGISDRERGPNPAATGAVSPLPAASGNTHVPETSQGGVEPTGGGVGGGPLHMKFSRDAALSRIPAPHLLKQEQLQLAGAGFREKRCQQAFDG